MDEYGKEAGRKLDELVEYKVMGSELQGVAYNFYSTTWEGMRLVVERMRKLGFTPSMEQAFTGEKWTAYFDINKSSGWVTGSAATLPHAVCLAALAAVSKEKA